MNTNFKNQVVWITGASSGIGEALAHKFASLQSKIILTARRTEKLAEIKKNLIQKGINADHITVLPADLSNISTFPDLTKKAISIYGTLDVLINNAGISQRGYAADTAFEVEMKIFNLDLLSPIALTKAVLPHFLQKKEGRIIVTSSLLGVLEIPASTSYCGAKHGVNGYFGALAYELLPLGIQVHVLQPGFVKTEISLQALNSNGENHGKMDSDHSKAMTAETFANRAFPQILKNKVYITVAGKEGLAVYVKRFCPGLYQFLVLRMAHKLFKERTNRN